MLLMHATDAAIREISLNKLIAPAGIGASECICALAPAGVDQVITLYYSEKSKEVRETGLMG